MKAQQYIQPVAWLALEQSSTSVYEDFLPPDVYDMAPVIFSCPLFLSFLVLICPLAFLMVFFGVGASAQRALRIQCPALNRVHLQQTSTEKHFRFEVRQGREPSAPPTLICSPRKLGQGSCCTHRLCEDADLLTKSLLVKHRPAVVSSLLLPVVAQKRIP